MILLIDNEPDAVLADRCMFFRMGLHSLVCRPDAITTMIFKPVHTVLIMRPEYIEDLPAVCHEIRQYFFRVPLAMMYRPPHGSYYMYLQLADAVFDDNVTTAHFANFMYDLYKRNTGIDVRDMIYDCVRAIAGTHYICICGERLPATHEQVMLTRYLLFRAPRAAAVEDLRQACFNPARLPQPSNVHTQFSRLNKTILRGTDLRKIHYKRDIGYFIL